MVIGRGAQLARTDRLLASARLGTSEVLVSTGEAGIGLAVEAGGAAHAPR